jgi:hypothetical protein
MLLAQEAAVSADGEAHALVKTIDCACNMLNNMITCVLQLKQMQRGAAISLAHRGFDPRAAIAAAAESAQALYPTRGVAFVTGCDNAMLACGAPITPSTLPGAVYGDADRLGECVKNILLTALRLSSWEADGSVQLMAVCEEGWRDCAAGGEEGGGRLALRITADAPGRPLTRAECDALLQPFGLAPRDKV